MVMLISRRGSLFTATCSMMARRKNSQAALLKLDVGERSKLNLFSTALTPGYAFGVLIIVVCAFNYVPQGALVPSLLVAAVASLLSGFCYSELVSHVANGQRETSVYELLYKWLNEGFAYFAAWISVVYHTCATALCARILAVCCDVLSNGALNKLTVTSGLTGIELDLGVALVVIPCGILLMPWNPLNRLIVDPSNGRVRTWVNFLLISSALVVEGVFVAGVAFLRHSTVKPAPPPGGVLGNTIAAVIFRHSEATGLLTGAVLCVSIFLAPQFSLQGFPLSASQPNNNGCPPDKNKIKPHKDLPCIVVLSAFGNFLFCLALIAALCSLSKPDTALLSDPLTAHASSEASVSIAVCINWVVTVLSTVSLALLIISNLAELNKIMQTLGQDGLFPRVCKRHHLFVSVVISIWSGLVLRAGQLVMMMSSGPVLMNVLICFCTIVFRYRKVETRKPAVFSYNLIVGGSADNEQTPILAKSDSLCESPSTLSASNTNNDSAEEDRIGDSPFKEEEDIDDIVNEYKTQHSLSQESLPILPPHRRAKLTRKPRRVKYFIVGLLACFVCVSIMLQGLSCSFHLSPTILATLAACAAAAALCAVVLIIALAQQKQVIPKKNRPNKSGKPALMFRVPMSPWLPALGAFLNVLLFVDVFTTNLCSMFCWFIAGSLVYVLYGAHHSAATVAFPCVLQTNSRQMISHSEDGTDVKVTLEPLPTDPWGDSDDQADEEKADSQQQQRKQRAKKKDPFNPIDNIVMKL